MNNPELEKEYELFAPLCEQFGRELTRQLEELLSQKNISLGFPLQYRVKKFDSVMQKIERASLGIPHIQELNDLIGLRIILLFRRDVELVRALIKKNLKVYSEEDTQSRLGEGEFGYSSIHFQVGLLPSWKKMPTFKQAGELKAEIQVRTVAQHIWAAASHLLQYKQEAGVPPPVRRSIHRVSALLETVDLEFERVLDERKKYLERAKAKHPDEILNVDLLAKTLDGILPRQNKVEDENYASLLEELFACSIVSQSQLKQFLSDNLREIMEVEKVALKQVADQGLPKDVSDAFRERFARGVYFTHTALVRIALRLRFKQRWEAARKKRKVKAAQ